MSEVGTQLGVCGVYRWVCATRGMRPRAVVWWREKREAWRSFHHGR